LFSRKKAKDCRSVADTEHPHKNVNESVENANNFPPKDWKNTLNKEISIVMKNIWW
jgi:hypothetical protein